jgi:hypothetical protein
VAVSRRIAHANPTGTLNTRGHLFGKADPVAVTVAIEQRTVISRCRCQLP